MEADSEQAVGSMERVRLETILRAAGCLPVREPVAGNKTHDSRLNIFFSTILNNSPFSIILHSQSFSTILLHLRQDHVPSETCIILLNGLRFNLAFVLYHLFVPEIQQTLQLGIPIQPKVVSARKK